MKKNLILSIVLITAVMSLIGCDPVKVDPPMDPADQTIKERLYPIWKHTPQGKEWGYINESGKVIVSPQFESAEFFSSYGSAVVGVKGKKGLISLKGDTLLKPVYDALAVYQNDRRVGIRDGSWTEMLDSEGKAVYETALAINPMPEGGARIQEYVGDHVLEGYINDAGNVTIEPQFIYGTDFVGDKAVVKKAEDECAIIDPTGRVLLDFEAKEVKQPTEDTFAFQQTGNKSKLWGYRDMTGKIIIKPAYAQAEPFNKGIAIVAESQKGEVRFGLIDTKGKFILRPKYERIEDLGNGFYAISRKAGPDAGQRSYPMAIFNINGKRLTDYLYYDVSACTADTVSVSDGDVTWVLDSAGTPMSTMPRISGMGTIRQVGGLLVSQADDERAYFTLAGKLIWQSPWESMLKDAVKLKRMKFRPDRGKIIYFPVLTGLVDTSVQDTINSVLYQQFVGEGAPSIMVDGVPEETVRVDYTGQLNKDLLIIEKTVRKTGKDSEVIRRRMHFDITDGTQFGLQDLFRVDIGWPELLANKVKDKISNMPAEASNRLNPELVAPVTEDRVFKAGRYGLILYYDSSELGGAASEPLSFEIPYAEILKDISTEGRMWNAFLKQDM